MYFFHRFRLIKNGTNQICLLFRHGENSSNRLTRWSMPSFCSNFNHFFKQSRCSHHFMTLNISLISPLIFHLNVIQQLQLVSKCTRRPFSQTVKPYVSDIRDSPNRGSHILVKNISRDSNSYSGPIDLIIHISDRFI